MSTNPSKDRASLCCFSFADGRQCRTPRSAAHPHFCVQHAQKEALAVAAVKLGNDISTYFNNNNYLSACDLSLALGQLFSCVAQGLIKPKTAATLAYLGQTLVQSIPIACHEYTNAFGTDSWRQVIRASFADPDPEPDEDLDPAPTPKKQSAQ
jgi:hypothetical protein